MYTTVRPIRVLVLKHYEYVDTGQLHLYLEVLYHYYSYDILLLVYIKGIL